MAETKLSLKLLVDKKANKVLFAEARKDFVDFLFSLLSLPMGSIIKLLTSPNMTGCIGNLYQSLENIDEAYILPSKRKDSFLNPTLPNQASGIPLLLPDVRSAPSGWGKSYSSPRSTLFEKSASCSHRMPEDVPFGSSLFNTTNADSFTEKGIVKGSVTYMVLDDLSVSPMSMVSTVTLLNKCNVANFSMLEERVVEFGTDEGLALLKASLQSKTALSDVFVVKEDIKVEA